MHPYARVRSAAAMQRPRVDLTGGQARCDGTAASVVCRVKFCHSVRVREPERWHHSFTGGIAA